MDAEDERPAQPLTAPTETTDVGAEMMVLGAIMCDYKVIEDVMDTLVPDDFYRPLHGEIYRKMCDRFVRDEPIDLQTIANDFVSHRGFNSAGGAVLLASMVEMSPVYAWAPHYARIVYEKAVRRRYVSASMSIAQVARDPGSTLERIGAKAADLIEAAERHDGSQVSYISDILTEAIDSLSEEINEDEISHLGILDVDTVVGPVLPGQLIIFAGRPGMGKSVALLQAARQNAFKLGKSVLTISLEMTKNEWVLRTISAQSGVPSTRMQARTMSDDDWGRIRKASSEMEVAKYGIIDTPDITLAQIIALARQWKRKVGRLDQIHIDYLQLLQGDERLSRQEQISAFTRGLKIAAKMLNCAIICAAQLNRGAEGRTDKKPALSDLRESGSIEQDADVVILLYRPDYYDPDDRPNEIDFIIAKHRDGPTATVTCVSQLALSRFRSISALREE